MHPRPLQRIALCTLIGLFSLGALLGGTPSGAMAKAAAGAPAPPKAEMPATADNPTPTAANHCPQKHGSFTSGWLPDAALSTPMAVLVYLPPCYNPTKAYPVLFLLHGQGYTQKQWVRLGATRVADRLITTGQAPPFLIVMPREQVWKDPPETGFDEAFLHTLIPWVQTRFKVRKERRYWAIGGLSRGAAWAIHFGLSHWDRFGSIGAHSPPVFWSDVRLVGRWLYSIPQDKWPRIYMDIGRQDTDEIMDSAVWFERLLTRNGFPHEWHLNEGAHTERYWSAHVEEYLRWYTAAWKANGPRP